MDAVMVIVLAIVIPLLLLPAAFIWYLNLGGITAALREGRAMRKRPVANPATK